MDVARVSTSSDRRAVERSLAESLVDRLWSLPRSITGEGVRRTHDILSEILSLDRYEVPSGETAFDWTVPKEWRVDQAFLVDPNGRRMFDFEDNPLHLVNYSIGFRGLLSRRELDAHLHSIPELPDAIPYITSYFVPRWGFCVPHRERVALPDGDYQVVVDASHFQGSLTYSECVLLGQETPEKEILLSTHTCHPAMGNDQLSGVIALALLARRVSSWPHRRKSFRFLFVPETIGSITWLSQQSAERISSIEAGFVCVLLSNAAGGFVYRRSRRGNSLSDRVAELVLKRSGHPFELLPFNPSRGNDQRQYCSPGFDLPIGCLTHSPERKENWYHTSMDNKARFDIDTLLNSVEIYEKMLDAIDLNLFPIGTKQRGEPFMTQYGLTISGLDPLLAEEARAARMWLLNYADGKHDMVAISTLSGISIRTLDVARVDLERVGLLERTGGSAI
jgi:aminopeptidase-like protein